ncbi:hypothetical protein FEM48_Zijuj02G0059200 [Ziziphus jujuba var. spinosa]|uniref:Zinc finger CCCH domain-containing protein 49-like n=1 Tax=Ziziphus jujuba var. spinosa TaxID=714518 RepID=A0A978VU09_ZIZJJ|nr:hypothetical protein FEM48_Zijuj02G0059200 [Ziziphus jujuba var. spinosa]
MQAGAGIDYESSYGKVRANDTILKLQRTEPYYKRNRAHICSFYIRGACTRGDECPYRHEMPITGELSKQNIEDRYYGYVHWLSFRRQTAYVILRECRNERAWSNLSLAGSHLTPSLAPNEKKEKEKEFRVNDPVALKLLNKAGDMSSLEPPDDKSIKTLYVGGVNASITDQDLRDHFYAHGEIESVKMVLQRACAFVTYTTRERAEKAAEELSNKLVIKGLRLKLSWGRPKAPKQQEVAHSGLLSQGVISQQQSQLQPDGTHYQGTSIQYYNIPPLSQQESAYYPSMDLKEWVPLLICKRAVSVGWRICYNSIMHFKLCFHYRGNTEGNVILNIWLRYHLTSSTLLIILQCHHHSLSVCTIRICSSRI